MRRCGLASCAAGLTVVCLSVPSLGATSPGQQTSPAAVTSEQALVDQYCLGCHNNRTLRGGLSLEGLALDAVADHVEVWERAVRKLRAGAMPPTGAPRPDAAGSSRLLAYLETELDTIAAASPHPGRTETFRRLNRTEYRNAVRDLLALDVDVTALLPRDDASFGFDNISVTELSPTLMERYLSAAHKISRLAVGSMTIPRGSRVVTLRPDLTQEGHLDGLPFGTRGGTILEHTFPLDGEYQIEVRLARNRNENVEGLRDTHVLEMTLDGERLELFTVVPDRNRLGSYYADEGVDKHLNLHIPVTAGPHVFGAAFLQKSSALIETERQPYRAQFNQDRHPRQQPAVYSVSITGPFDPTGAGNTPSRDRIFTCRPATAADEADCAATIISTLARRAYRRPVSYRDLEVPLAFYEQGRGEGDFESGIELALRALLTSPEFLFRIERDPEDAAPGTAYYISDVELASRLSFFLWASIPDDELRDLAEAGHLGDTAVLEAQVRRMLGDPRAATLTTNFADQWLYLRNLDTAAPNLRLFPDFDDNLRSAFRQETQMLFASIVAEDRNVLDLLRADYTFLNERLARHYGIPDVYGTQFRRVALPADSVRGGLLGHGSILTVTSYATRTSPVLRGKWILENLLGMPPPPPPPNVPPLEEPEPGVAARSMRERMGQHRANAVCAACHRLMDPAGLSMENFDAIGRWRNRSDDWTSIDASGSIPGSGSDGFTGVGGLRDAVLARPEVFVGTMTEKLMTYALGRGLDHYDGPAVRQIVRSAAGNDNKFSSLVLGIVESIPFQMRRSQE